MKNKKFDCVEMQRKIRAELWTESGENPEKLNLLIDEELKKSELFKLFKNRKVSSGKLILSD